MSRVTSMRHRRLERTRGRCRAQSPVHPTQRPALCWAFHRTRLRRVTRPRPARPHYSPSLPRPALITTGQLQCRSSGPRSRKLHRQGGRFQHRGPLRGWDDL